MPDVNESQIRFLGHEGKIRFGLSAIRNVGEGVVEKIIDSRGPMAPSGISMTSSTGSIRWSSTNEPSSLSSKPGPLTGWAIPQGPLPEFDRSSMRPSSVGATRTWVNIRCSGAMSSTPIK